jgi:hypothetical protein
MQFGFRFHHSTLDAIHVLRRKSRFAWAQQGGSALVLALDWAKAFDSIDPASLLRAETFGLPSHLLEVFGAIYTGRRFVVHDCGTISEERPQHGDISQGCPLSPSPFDILMTVLMEDSVAKLLPQDHTLLQNCCLAELL